MLNCYTVIYTLICTYVILLLWLLWLNWYMTGLMPYCYTYVSVIFCDIDRYYDFILYSTVLQNNRTLLISHWLCYPLSINLSLSIITICYIICYTICYTICYAFCYTICYTVCCTFCYTICYTICYTVCYTICYTICYTFCYTICYIIDTPYRTLNIIYIQTSICFL